MYCHAQTLAASRYQTMSISSGTFCSETQLNASHLHGCSGSTVFASAVMGEKKSGEKKKKVTKQYSPHTFQKSIKVTVFMCA